MKIERQQLFELLEPPAGGVSRLEQRMRESESVSFQRSFRPVMAAAMLLVVLVLVYRGVPTARHVDSPATGEVYNAAEFDRLLGRESASIQLLVMRSDQALDWEQLDGTRSNVRIYRLTPKS